MSRGQFKAEATNPLAILSDGTSDIQQEPIGYRDPNIQQHDNALALVPRSPWAVQTPQGSGSEGAVANVPRKLVLEREAVREATNLKAAITAGAFNNIFQDFTDISAESDMAIIIASLDPRQQQCAVSVIMKWYIS